MTTAGRIFLVFLVLMGISTVQPDFAHAYGGPGSVISGIGTLLAALAAILAAIFGFVWFPLKRLIQKMQDDQESASAEADSSGE